jgi:hypothetical protein
VGCLAPLVRTAFGIVLRPGGPSLPQSGPSDLHDVQDNVIGREAEYPSELGVIEGTDRYRAKPEGLGACSRPAAALPAASIRRLRGLRAAFRTVDERKA